MRLSTKISLAAGLLVFGLALAPSKHAGAAGATASQVQQIVNNSDQGWLTKFTSTVFDNCLYALTAFLEVGLFLVWLAVTWAVVRLYQGIGNFLIPIWDFSNGSGFFNAGEGAALAVVGVPKAASQLLLSMVPWILSLCGLLMFGLAALAIPKSVREGREPFDAVGGLAVAAGLMVAFPLLYSVPIHVGNFMGREFYESSHEKYMADSGQSANSSPPGMFDVLFANSIFPPEGPPAGNIGVAASGAYSVANTSQLSAAFDNLKSEFSPGGDAATAWATAKQAVMVDLEMQASRFVQVILGVMAIIALIGLLMLKGGQVVALVLNYYLGWIACALYVHPATRPVFGAWLKGHIRLCLWGLLWAFLIFVMDIIIVSSRGLQGMVLQADAAPGVFLGVGMFMMPFILFAAIHKFKQVAEFSDSLSATGKVASHAGASVHAAFAEGSQTIPVWLVKDAGALSAHGKAADAADGFGKAFEAKMGLVASAASKSISAVPGLGPLAAAGAKEGLAQTGLFGRIGAQGVGTFVRNANRFHGGPKGEPKYENKGSDGLRPNHLVDLTKKQRPQA